MMISKEVFSCICSIGSLVAILAVYTGLLTENKPVTITGQIIGALDLVLCALFFLLYL